MEYSEGKYISNPPKVPSSVAGAAEATSGGLKNMK